MFAITFLNPSLLWFAALAAAPILIYFFNRQRHRPMKWAAMEFVLRAVRSNRRRLRIENLLLLLLRMAAVLLMVLGLARPVARAIGPLADLTDKRSHVVIVLDTSYSMGFTQGATSVFERAKRGAHDLARDLLKRGDKFAVLLMADPPRFLYQDPVFVDDATKARVLRDIQEVELTAQPTDAARSLAALAAYLPRFERPGAAPGAEPAAGTLSKQVYIFTDLQRNAFATERGLTDPNLRRVAAELEREKAEIAIIDCGVEDAANVAVTRLEASDEVAGVDIPVKVAAAVKNFGTAAAPDLTLEFFVDDTLQASPSLSLEAGEEREIDRYVVFRDKGAHRVHVVLRTDGLPADNVRTLAIDVREAVDVLLVDGERKPDFGDSETDFLAAALAPTGEGGLSRDYLLRPQVVADQALFDLDLSNEPVLVLANVIALSNDQVERIESFVRAGGGLLIFLGPQVDPAIYDEKVWKKGEGLLPARLERIVTTPDEERYHVLDADTFHHPVLKSFAGKETRSLFSMARFEGYFKVDWPEKAMDDPALAALAWFEPRRATAGGEAPESPEKTGPAAGAEAGKLETRDPALVEKRFGRGRVMMFTSTADGEWNNFFAQYAYVMLWQKAVTYLADAGSARRNLLIGEPYEEIVPSRDYVSQILLTTPAQDQIEKTLERIPEEPDRFRLVYADTQRPGAYEVRHVGGGGGKGGGTGAGTGTSTSTSTRTGTDRIEYFAVNVEPEEGDLTRIDETELRSLVPELKFRLERERGADRSIRASDRPSDANELWRYALFGLLALLPIESLLALRFGRRAAV